MTNKRNIVAIIILTSMLALPNSYKNSIKPIEMCLVSLVKEFNIPRKDFEYAAEKLKQRYVECGLDLYHEDNEIPNADIIYTFDNKIINEYYRRK